MDGVLIPSKRRFSITLAERHGVSLETSLPFFNGIFQKCLTGDADLKEVIAPYLKAWGWTKGVDALLDYWFKLEHDINVELIEYIQRLRRKGVLCFLATNNEKYRFQYMLDKMGFADAFDKTFASAHLRFKKPDPEFFSKIYGELDKIQKNEILFVDDSAGNIEAARNFGIHTEHYTSLKNLKKKILFFNK